MARKTDSSDYTLIVRFSALGDVAMALPVIYDACRANPGERFIFLTRKLPAKLFLNAPDNLTVVGIDTNLYPGAKGMLRLFKEMRHEYGVSRLVDLHDVLRTRLLCFFARLKGLKVSKINKGRAEKMALTRSHSKKLIELPHTTERYREAFRKAGISTHDSFSGLYPEGKGNASLFADVAAPPSPDDKWIAIAPFAAHPGKIYPPELLKKVIDHYAVQPNVRIFIFGAGDKEKKIIDEMAAGRENVVNMADKKIGIAGELSLMSYCNVMLAMDSANMHLASLVGLRTVSIWGATHPYCGFYGIGQSMADAVQLDMVCRPCSVYGNKPCRRKDYHCLSGIPPQLIITRIDAL